MDLTDIIMSIDPNAAGREMHSLISRLYPICRSITGEGLRETLRVLRQHIPLEIHEVASGTRVFDWTIPKEWNITDAYIKNAAGERVVDFAQSNLHVVNYSAPVHRKLSLGELKEHLFSLPDYPAWIPYRTSYYKENWGFCLSHTQLLQLQEGEYEVCIDSSLKQGSLTYGEHYLQGDTTDEVLISCHSCHPSLCNDNLSGIAVSVYLAAFLGRVRRRYSYRFLFLPGTIGSIAWLCLNENQLERVKHGLVLACVGDAGRSTYKKSRRGNAEIDRAVIHVLKHSGTESDITDFVPYGYDERQYCSPAFNLPVGCFMRTPHGQFPEYHTSADNLAFVHPSSLFDSFAKCMAVFDLLESDKTYINQYPKCEPQLGKRGLYESLGGQRSNIKDEQALFWVLNLCDGTHSLLGIAERSGLKFGIIKRAAEVLLEHGLIKEL